MIQNTLIKFAIAFFIIFMVTACNEEKEGQQAVQAFLTEMSPELARKIEQIKKEISITEEKIETLSELKRKHPNYAGKIETSRRQWKVLQDKLKLSLKEIGDVVESTYVAYELDRIQGGNQFNKIAGELLASADSVLASAGMTKDAIEQASNEVEVEEAHLSSSNDISDISYDIHQPTERDTSETEESLTFEMTEEEPPTELEALRITSEQESLTSISSFCDAATSLANVNVNLMMMVMSTVQAEQDSFRAKIDKANTEFEKAIAMLQNGNQADADQFTALQETWMVFKNTHELEIIPAIMAGNNDEALEIAHSIQAKRMETMNDIIQAINGDNCD
ncbi:MAG: hypothetical protein DRQ49_16345 [Gammaproteobacteria bacterium]|nr:MAG: hypothetical protein DRQ49_16345 [Gammaproteobacteria bacterium]RKZ40738.1 MAG: hypothetical protein DRQ41_09045 [Gammaproteobacteria bacterium]RKZ72369.1 MAG: hypothetical protein DRQ57_17485 [Gammaproteobacteria bacterium]